LVLDFLKRQDIKNSSAAQAYFKKNIVGVSGPVYGANGRSGWMFYGQKKSAG
jgi:hypothetical protein